MQKPYFGNILRDSVSMDRWLAQRPAETVLEPDLPIIDAHHHLWDHRHTGIRYLFEHYQADLHAGHNIVATVFVEATSMYRAYGPEHLRPVGEVEFAAGAAAMADSGQYGSARVAEAIVGHADLNLGSAVREVLEAEIAASGGRLRGIRHWTVFDPGTVGRYVSRPSPPHHLAHPAFRAGVAELARLGLCFDAWVFHPQLDDVFDLACAFPDLPIVLNHAGTLIGVAQYTETPEAVAHWKAGMAKLARTDNVVVKLGGLGMPIWGFDFHQRAAPPTSEDLAAAWGPTIQTCIDLFGPTRCMFESNFPVDRQSCGYVECWNAFKRLTRSLSEDERRALFSGTAARTYRMQIP